MSEPAHLRVYRFESGAVFEGGLLGAIERMQLAGDTELLDALFVRAAPSTPWIWPRDASAARSRRCSISASSLGGAGRSRSARSQSTGAASRDR